MVVRSEMTIFFANFKLHANNHEILKNFLISLKFDSLLSLTFYNRVTSSGPKNSFPAEEIKAHSERHLS